MPRLSEMQMKNIDLSGYAPVESNRNGAVGPSQDLQPSFNTMMRCPIPSESTNPDNLRQFYMGGRVPQTRILSL